MDRAQLAEHLRFAAELGVAGTSRDPAWRGVGNRFARDPGNSEQISASSPAPDRVPQGVGNRSADPATVPVFQTAADALAGVRADIGDCTRCKLHTLGRKQIVFGVGNPEADLMFVGEAPGADEDLQGEPFVGRAGQLLTKIIEAIGLTREDVYIANVIKCRPPGNRNPEPDEVATCEPFLVEQIDTIKPKVIVALGKFAAQCLLRTTDPITRIRGKEFKYREAI